MAEQHRLAHAVLEAAHDTFVENVRNVSMDEALDAAGGFRSILGLMKHVAGWSAVYHSYAFDEDPRPWDHTDWPRGMRDVIEPSGEYFQEVLAWFERSYGRWLASTAEPAELDSPRPLHWGKTAPLREIVAMVAGHWSYHAGEINEILAICRGEAWEYGEEVEENHISTVGHRVRPLWITDEQAEELERRESGRRESNPHHQLGRLELYH
jgi:Protein of unknown function (DUF664)